MESTRAPRSTRASRAASTMRASRPAPAGVDRSKGPRLDVDENDRDAVGGGDRDDEPPLGRDEGVSVTRDDDLARPEDPWLDDRGPVNLLQPRDGSPRHAEELGESPSPRVRLEIVRNESERREPGRDPVREPGEESPALFGADEDALRSHATAKTSASEHQSDLRRAPEDDAEPRPEAGPPRLPQVLAGDVLPERCADERPDEHADEAEEEACDRPDAGAHQRERARPGLFRAQRRRRDVDDEREDHEETDHDEREPPHLREVVEERTEEEARRRRAGRPGLRGESPPRSLRGRGGGRGPRGRRQARQAG